MREPLRSALAVLATGALGAAQDGVLEQVALRVASLRPNGTCVVDRGKRDQVQVGDRVLLSPRNGKSVPGTVVEVGERIAVVELADPTVPIVAGTRGHVSVPRARRAAATPAPVAPPTGGAAAGRAAPEPEPWRPGQPLLGTTRPPRPAERPSLTTGRLYGASRVVRTLDSWSQSFLTAGADLEVDNVDGRGGILRSNTAFNWSTETSEQDSAELRVFEFSYERGGNRFEPWRWQVGRFLQRDMPEFGILDGVEVGYRQENGDRSGVSVGYLPELDENLESLSDLQVAAWHVWNQDVAERVSFALGYQKTWHRWRADRDLVVAKWRYLPLAGWDLQGTVWIDFYTASDERKSQSVEVTRANFFTSRRWQQVGGVEFFLDHEAYPDQLRRELPQTIQPATLADAHQDRASLHAFWFGAAGTRWFTRVTGWVDEERTGGAAELGVDVDGLLQQGARTTLAMFQVQGLASRLFGARVQHGGQFTVGRVDLLYELGFVHHEGFPADRDDLLQHRLGGLWTSDMGAGWNATCYGDGTLWDQHLSLGLGIYLQRYF